LRKTVSGYVCFLQQNNRQETSEVKEDAKGDAILPLQQQPLMVSLTSGVQNFANLLLQLLVTVVYAFHLSHPTCLYTVPQTRAMYNPF
jgi:hypothetical protein